jgi:hypothetical protein
MTAKALVIRHQTDPVEIRIEKGVAPPEGKWVGVFNTMEVGDSFQGLPASAEHSVRSALTKYRIVEDNGRKFTVRRAGPNHYRCWRVE